MRTQEEPLAARALRALGEQCEIPRDVEERILAALPVGLLEGASLSDRAGALEGASLSDRAGALEGASLSDRAGALEAGAGGPESGVFRLAGESSVGRALAALEAECAIPLDVEERILDSLLAAPAPVVQVASAAEAPASVVQVASLREAPTPVVQVASLREAPAPVVQVASLREAPGGRAAAAYEPLDGLIRRARADAVRGRRLGAGAAFVALLVAVLVVRMGGPTLAARAPTPLDVNTTQVPEGDPLLAEVRVVVTGLLIDVARDCHIDVGSALVWFERSGYVSLLDVPAGRSRDTACIERVAGRHWLDRHDRATLVQLTVRREPDLRGRELDENGGAPPPSRASVRLLVWRVDET